MTDKKPRKTHKHRDPNICRIWGKGIKKTRDNLYA